MRLRSKVAIITGASRGIGECMAKMFAKEGASLGLCARNLTKLQQIKAEIESAGGQVLVVKADMRRRDEVKDMVEQVVENFGSIDILVNNAGLPLFGYAVDDPDPAAEERYEAIMETNLRGYWYTIRFAVPVMKGGSGGSIINISSVRGHGGLPNDSAYCAAKGAVQMLTRALAVELAPYNIRVNTISPGSIQVAVGHWVLSRYGESAHAVFCKKYAKIHEMGMRINQPLRTIGQPEDVAYAAAYLASDEAKFVTGADLAVDGGETALLAEPSALDLEALSEYYETSRELRTWLESL